MTFRLREHVRIERSGEATALVDSLVPRQVALGPAGSTLVDRLDGRPLADMLTCPEDETVLRRLILLNAVAGAGDPIVERLRRIRDGTEELGLQILEGARFQCQGSGECCQNYVFGPLDDDDIVRLDSLDLSAFGPGPYYETRSLDSGQQVRALVAPNDRCMFLRDDRKCGLHAKFGADAKPKLCRQYPLEVLICLDGMRIFDKGSCATFAVSSRSGLPLIDDLSRVRQLIEGRAHGLFHPIVKIDEYACDFGHFDRFLKVSLALVKRRIGTAPETLRALSRGLRHFADALRSFPLAPGQPDAALDEALGGDVARWYEGQPPEEEVRRGALRLFQLFEALFVGASGIIGFQAHEKGWLSAPQLREAAQLFHIAAGLCHHVGEPDAELDPYIAQLAAVVVPAEEVDEPLRISMRQQLFGLGVLVNNQALAGMLRLVFTQILACAGARLRALMDGRQTAVAADLSHGHMLASRVLAGMQAQPVLVSVEDFFSEMTEALPAALALS
jgi:Fe-S-cluster containining protein